MPGGVPQLVQRRVRVGRLRVELARLRQHHAVILAVVAGAVVGHVVEPDAAGLDQRFGALAPPPLRRRRLQRAQLEAIVRLSPVYIVGYQWRSPRFRSSIRDLGG